MVVAAELKHQIRPDGIVFTLVQAGRALPPADWANAAAPTQLPAISHVLAALETDARESDGGVLVSHDHIANLASADARNLGLAPVIPFILDLRNEGTFDRPNFSFTVRWLKANGQPVMVPARTGAFMTVGGATYRIPAPVYQLVTAVDRFNVKSATDVDGRHRDWAELQELLPTDATSAIRTTGYLQTLRIGFADAFSLEVGGTLLDVDFDPVLHAPRRAVTSGTDEADPSGEPPGLLPSDYQKVFAKERFRRFAEAKATYALGDGWYVVMSPALQKALNVVRTMQGRDPGTKKEFLRNPRLYLREALGDAYEESFIEGLFVETSAYSDRVKAIGIWQPKVLPWIVIPRQPWFPPENYGLTIGGANVVLQRDDVANLQAAVQAAMAAGQASVEHNGNTIPATQETLDALNELAGRIGPQPAAPEEAAPAAAADGEVREAESASREKVVLLIETNFEETLFEAKFQRRKPELPDAVPRNLLTAMKPHQRDGLKWLQSTWQTGRPGVLLADDMGLGKTLQALAFLAWLREAMADGRLPRAPILIVAPTGLLANWEQEHSRHLQAPGLGRLVRAHGPDLRELKQDVGRDIYSAKPCLNEDVLRDADWVLATYETIRDYQHSFGRMPFAAIVFDEVQKIKTPGTLVTDAAKAMKADFRIAMTGTPVENRLADLWCIVDTVQPGLLGDLKVFSRTYEANPDPVKLKALKDMLQLPHPTRPPVLLRRMKDFTLEALPEKKEEMAERPMPPPQESLYRAIVERVRGEVSQSGILKALHELRVASLHPWPPGSAHDDDYIAASARYAACFDILDWIHDRQEKALIFLEFREPQAYLRALIQRRYRLREPPMLINGTVAGAARQERVNRFQRADKGFDVIILSPRAGGVGLTLTAANHVIHLSRWWNPAVEDQCTDRVYRIGQEKPVRVYYPMAVLPNDEEHSFDRRLHKLLEEKRALSREMLCPPAPTDDDASRLFTETVGA